MFDELKLETKHNACFPAGTRITTDKGLKRIEDIQVGDMVLSKHESGIGEQEFKPVVRTVVHHNKEIWGLEYCIVRKSVKPDSLSDFDILNMSRKGNVSVIRATPNHPFWVKGQGWTSLDKLQKGQLLELKDSDTLAYIIFVSPEYQTNHVNITASYGFENEINFGDKFIDSEYSKLYTFNKYENNGDFSLLRNGENVESPINDMNIGEISATNQVSLQTVYNFEVADYHTYYIFDEMWVHNACPKFSIKDVKSYNKNVPVPKSHSEISKQFMRAVTEDGACFPAGTLVHTDKGLVPIQDLKIGDLVLSQPEWGGEESYKPIVNTFRSHEAKNIYALRYIDNFIESDPDDPFNQVMNLKGMEPSRIHIELLTENHPVWVNQSEALDISEGWQCAIDLNGGESLVIKNKEKAGVIFLDQVMQTGIKDVFFLKNDGDHISFVIDLRDYKKEVYYVAHLVLEAYEGIYNPEEHLPLGE